MKLKMIVLEVTGKFSSYPVFLNKQITHRNVKISYRTETSLYMLQKHIIYARE